MLQFLKKPYPTHEANRKAVVTSIVVGLFVGIFLYVFKPFGMTEIRPVSKQIFILGYGVITFCVVWLFLYLIPKTFPNIQDERTWTVSKEIMYMNLMILTIAIFNTLYTPFLSSINIINIQSFSLMIMNTFLIGIMPISFLVFSDFYKLQKKYVHESESIHVENLSDESPYIPIILEADNESFTINPRELLYIESVGNYANIVSYKDGKQVMNLYRSTLKNIESQIKHKHIIRCHRSFFVNLDKVNNVDGNAQGFKLGLDDSEDIVPVSRKYVPIIKAFFA